MNLLKVELTEKEINSIISYLCFANTRSREEKQIVQELIGKLQSALP